MHGLLIEPLFPLPLPYLAHLVLEAVARARQHLVHAGEHHLGGARERQRPRVVQAVGAEPRALGGDRYRALGAGGVVHGGGVVPGHGLAQARHHQRREHVARPAEVAVEHGERDAEESRLAVRCHARADDGHGAWACFGGGGGGGGRGGGAGERQGDGCDDDVRDAVVAVQDFDGVLEGGGVGDLDAGEESVVLFV